MNKRIKLLKKTGLVACFCAVTGPVAHGYEIWYGMPYLPQNAANDISLWENVAPEFKGINANFRDIQRPVEERNTIATWRNSLERMPNATNSALLALPRPEFQFEGGRDTLRTLEETLTIRFRQEARFRIRVRYLMLYNERPNENLALDVVEYTDAEIQEIRDWLDDNGHTDVILTWDVRSNSRSDRLFSQKPAFQCILMEGSPLLWERNSGSRRQYITAALTNSLIKDKEWIMQVPTRNVPGLNLYESMRWFMRYIPQILGDFDFFRRDDVSIMPITYGPGDQHFPELEPSGEQYGNTMMGFALSIVEQKDLFEGRLGEVSEAQAMSFNRRLTTHEVGTSVDAVLFDAESAPDDENIIRRAANNVGFIVDGSWLRYEDFNFGDEGFGGLSVVAATPKTGSRIEVRINSETGPLLGIVRIGNTGGWGRYQTFSNQISSRTGVRDLYLVFRGGSGGLLNLRSFQLLSRSETRETVRIENTARNILDYSGIWRTQNQPLDSGGSMRYSNIAGNSVKYTFTGDRVKVGVRTGPAGGTCRVLLDGNIVKNFTNTQADSPNHQEIIYDSGVLFSQRAHTVELVVLGSGGNVMFDFFETAE